MRQLCDRQSECGADWGFMIIKFFGEAQLLGRWGFQELKCLQLKIIFMPQRVPLDSFCRSVPLGIRSDHQRETETIGE